MKSMTGFAEKTQTGEGFHVDLRMRAVNGKHLDAQFRMPDTLLSLEPRLLTILKQQVNRGRVTIWVDLHVDDPERAGVKLNTHLLGNLARQFDEWVWIDETSAVRPLSTQQRREHEPQHPFATIDR